MNHPFITNKQLLYIYGAIWILIGVIHIVFLNLFYLNDWFINALDSIVFNFLFFVLGFALWYPMNFYKTKESKKINLLINHISLLVFSGFIWLGASYNILNYLAGDNTLYKDFLYSSLFFRGISGVFYYSNIVLIYYILNYYSNLQQKISSEAKLKELLKEAELNYLKAQINPHFLFNSLNSISALTLSEPAKAQEMIIKLSDFLRYVISQTVNKPAQLSEELENIQRYLEIEKIRFGAKLNFEFNLSPDAHNKEIPMLILQPLYENAIKHGVYESTTPINIITTINTTPETLNISISNNYEKTATSFKSAGIGLRNIKERLRIMYQNTELLKVNKTDNRFEVQLLIPQN